MDELMDPRERISALADGQLQGEAFARAMEAADADRQVLQTWHAYHLIGDTLRSADLAGGTPAPQFLERLSGRLAQEPAPSRVPDAPALPLRPPAPSAANDGSFRWKVVAGFASAAAFAAVGWTVVGAGTQPGGTAPQLAAAAPQPASGAAPGTVLARSEPGIMIRDARLDEMLAAHRQLGAASALQAPAGFLRNATFEGPAR